VVADYSIWIVEYARVVEYPVGAVLYGRWNAGHLVLPYCYAVLKGEDHLAVVDAGFNYAEFGKVLADTYNVSNWRGADVVLGRIGIDPAEVDTMVLTHNHFDHAGGVEFFPNAHVYLQEREVTNYLWAHGLPARLQWLTTAVDPDLMLWLVGRMKANKLTLLRDETEIIPGVRAIPALDTHTAGSQYVTVENERDGNWLLAGDNCYVYESFTGANDGGAFIPIGLAFGSMERCMLTMEEMWQYVDGEVTRIVPFHEQRLWETFPSQQFDDTLHVAELSLATGEPSRITA
jgi:glyoxylase-like metal-dependent hydrolase (beta-lactamase superfamily II)